MENKNRDKAAYSIHEGLTKREYAVIQIVNGHLSNHWTGTQEANIPHHVGLAIKYVDEIFKQLEE